MDVSIFLARFLGVLFLIVTAIWVFRKKELESLVPEILSSKSTLFVLGLINLLMGLAIVIGHPIWAWDWRGLITLLGYVTLLSGITRLAFPIEFQRFAKKANQQIFWPMMGFLIVVGCILTYYGFTTF